MFLLRSARFGNVRICRPFRPSPTRCHLRRWRALSPRAAEQASGGPPALARATQRRDPETFAIFHHREVACGQPRVTLVIEPAPDKSLANATDAPFYSPMAGLNSNNAVSVHSVAVA
jgi:hypothetical protein